MNERTQSPSSETGLHWLSLCFCYHRNKATQYHNLFGPVALNVSDSLKRTDSERFVQKLDYTGLAMFFDSQKSLNSIALHHQKDPFQ